MQKGLSFLFTCCLFLSFALPAEAKIDVIKKEARENLRNQKWDAVIQDINNVIKALDNKVAPADVDLYFILGHAYFLKKLHRNALLNFQTFLTHLNPKSPYLFMKRKALFYIADSHAALGEYEEAVKIYQNQANQLLSLSEKNHLSQIYLEVAKSYFKPADKEQKPDYARAYLFFQKAIEMGIEEKKTREILFDMGTSAYHAGQYQDSIRIFTQEQKKEYWNKSGESVYLLGLSYIAWGNATQARTLYQDFLRAHPKDSFSAQIAYQIAKTYGIPYPAGHEREIAVRALENFVEQYPASAEAPEAFLQISLIYFHSGLYSRAVEEFNRFLKQYEKNPKEEIQKMASQAVRFKGFALLYQKKYLEGLSELRRFQVLFPADPEWNNVQQQVIDTEYAQGNDFYVEKEYKKAKDAWGSFLRRYPLDYRCPNILFEFGRMEYENKAYQKALEEWKVLISKYPYSQQASHAQYLTGYILESHLHKYEEALQAYEKVQGAYHASARMRITALKENSLTIEVPSVFRSTEKPYVEVSIRNMNQFEVLVYQVNLNEYFSRMQTADGMTSLDVGLIEPDLKKSLKIEKFTKYALHKEKVLLDQTKPGLYVVKAVSQNYESTSLLAVSDLGIVVKASQNDIFIFAQNLAKNKPQSDTTISLSDGEKIFFEGKSSADGILHTKFPEKKEIKNLRILAFHENSYSSQTMELGGLQKASRLEERAFVYTERPAYRPGDKIYYRAILRKVSEGKYVAPKAKKYKATLFASTGEVLSFHEKEISDFGTLHGSFSLPANALLGNYRIMVQEKDLPTSSFSTEFAVQHFELKNMELRILPERKVYVRGEKIRGKILLQYFYGAPVVAKKVLYRLSPKEFQTVFTNPQGEIAFEMDSAEYGENTTLLLEAQVPEEGVQERMQIYLSPQEYNLQISLLRTVFLAGEKFEATVKVKDLSGSPMEQKIKVEVFRIEKGRSQNSQVLQSGQEISTDSKKGEGKALLSLEKGGSYLIRATGKDRWGNRILAEKKFFVSGNEDTMKVRFLSNQSRWKVGEKASLTILSRIEEDSLALVTWEGEIVHRYSLITLKKGQNAFSFDVTPDLFPNFSLALTVFHDKTSCQVRQEFQSEKGLDISLKTKESNYAPNDAVDLTIETKDQNGKAASAELSIAVVDEALFSLYQENLPDIAEVFYKQRRGILIQTRLGYTFHAPTQSAKLPESLLKTYQESANMTPPAQDPRRERRELGKLADNVQTLRQQGQGFEGPRANWHSNAPNNYRYRANKPQEYGQRGVGNSAGEPDDSTSTLTSESKLEALRALLQGTIFFQGDLVTDAQGQAQIRFALPGNISKYRVIAFGVTKDTLVSRAQTHFTASKSFFVTLKSPSILREGDLVKFRVEAHNRLKNELKSSLKVTVKAGSVSQAFEQELSIPAGSMVSFMVPYQVSSAGSLEIYIEAKSGDMQDVLGKSLTVMPWGTPVVAGGAGIARGKVRKEISLPELAQGQYQHKSLQISVLPSLDSSFIRKVLSSTSLLPNEGASRGLVLLSSLKYLLKQGRMPAGEMENIQGEIRSLIEYLSTAQNRDSSNEGGWAFNQKRGTSPEFLVSAQTLLFLARAKVAGYPVQEEALNKGKFFLKKIYGTLRDDSVKAFIIQVLCELGDDNFAQLNRLYRYRNLLNSYGLARLSLSYSQIGRQALAKEVAGLILLKPFFSAKEQKFPQGYGDLSAHWMADPVETTALCISALIHAGVSSPKIGEAVEYLLRRYASSFQLSPKGMAAFVEAVSLYQEKKSEASSNLQLEIHVNGKFHQTLTMDGNSQVQTLSIPEKFLEEKNIIELDMSGRGSYAYWITLTGFTSESLKKKEKYQVQSWYEPAPQKMEGQNLTRGWSVVEGSYKPFYNSIENLKEGDWAYVNLKFTGFYYMGYLIVEEPIPAGVRVDPKSIEGHVDHYELHPDKIIFAVRQGAYLNTIRFKVYGNVPGKYRVSPTRAYALYQPWIFTWGNARDIQIAPSNSPLQDPYKLSPDELYQAGKILFEKKKYKESLQHLSTLFSQTSLRDWAYKDVVRMLLFIHLELGPDREVVRHFENLKERYPELEIGFEEILKIGKSYIAMKEFERGLYVFRAILESAYLQASKIYGDLQEMGKVEQASKVLGELFWKYPRSSYTGESLYSFSQLSYEKATASSDKKQKAELLRLSTELLEEFLVYYSDSPICDEVSFSLANAYMDQENLAKVLEICRIRQKLHPKSQYQDDFTYLEAYAAFREKNYSHALQTFEKVATAQFPSPQGEGPSSYANLAYYLMAQIHHAEGAISKALQYYGKISLQYPDAKETVEFFEQKVLKSEEVIVSSLKKEPQVTLKYRNLQKAEYKIYQVDLLRLYILRKNLSDITKIHLAGIKPYSEGEIVLSEKNDYQIHEKVVPLPLKKSGAYLVVFKAENMAISTMFVFTQIKLEIQEDATSGRVRVNVLDQDKNTPEEKVYVKIIGSGDSNFRYGWTDVRGIFLVDNIKGQLTVIARKGDHYSLYRGTQYLQAGRGEANEEESQQQKVLPLQKQTDYLKEIRTQNKEIQGGNIRKLQRYFEGKKGVQIEQTK